MMLAATESPTVKMYPVSGHPTFQPKSIRMVGQTRATLGVGQGSTSNGLFNLSNTSTSPSHAELWLQGGQIFIKDLGSAQGTYVNGFKITNNTLLRHGDVVTLGRPLTPTSSSDEQSIPPVVATIEVP